MPIAEPPETPPGSAEALPAEDRLHLPGPRGLWWALGVLAVALPLLTVLGAADAPQEGDQAIDLEVRQHTLTWRTWAFFGPPKRPPTPQTLSKPLHLQSDRHHGSALPVGVTAAEDPFGTLQADIQVQRRAELRDLFARAARIDARLDAATQTHRAEGPAAPLPGKPRKRKTEQLPHRSAELVVVHAMATHDDVLATELARKIARPSDDLRAALAGLPTDVTGAVADVAELTGGMSAVEAAARARAPGFGTGWSSYTRDRIRVRLHQESGDLPAARTLLARLREADGRIAAGWLSLLLVIFLAGSVGFVWLSLGALRTRLGRLRGEGPLDWLRVRYVGLGAGPRPYNSDPLVPLLGFGAWFVGYLAASLFGTLLSGARPAHGLAMLLQSLAGVLLAYAVVQAFASRSEPLRSAARMGGPEATPFWQASTAALLAYCALLPVMAVVVTLSAILVGEGSQAHPVAGFLLEDADPLQIAALGVAVVIGAPIGEELLFRGFLYRTLRQRFGIRVGLATTAVLFALLHMAPTALLPYVTLGVAFALVYEWVGSLWASIVLHGLWNAVVFSFVTAIALS